MNTTTSNSYNPSGRIFGFWGNLSLVRKLLIAFGVLFIFSVVIAVITLRGLNQVQADYEHALAQGSELQNLSDELQVYLLQARRYEKNFILRWQDEGFDTAYANYAVPYKEQITAMRETLKSLAPFGAVAATVSTGDMTQAQYEADIDSLNQLTDSYEQSFNSLIDAMRQKGSDENIGLEASLRDAAHNIESKIYDHNGLEKMSITMLQIRRREKDYIERQDQLYIDEVHALGIQLKVQVTESDLLTTLQKPELRTMIDKYIKAFDAVVEKDREIAIHNEELITAARAVEPLAAKIENLGEQLATEDIDTARLDSTQTFTISVATVLAALALSIFLAIALSRQITQPITQLTNTAQMIASGNFEAQADVSSADEVGTLAQTFNTMTSKLRQAFEDVRRRTLAVQTSAEVSRRLSAAINPRQLAVDVVEQVQSAFHYYHAHIYFVDETTGDLVMAGGTGEVGSQLLARNHKVSKGRGLAGRAAATNAPVFVPDVTKAEGWLPNPLLPDTKSEIAVPIFQGKQVLGVLDVQQNTINGLSEEDVELLQSLAGQVAISLQNARAFEESRARAELESMVNAIGQKIQRASSMEETLQTAIREIGLALGASSVRASVAGRENKTSQN